MNAAERALPGLEAQRRLRGLVARLAWSTPWNGHWKDSWGTLQADAKQEFAALRDT